jgi:hypothetical protein
MRDAPILNNRHQIGRTESIKDIADRHEKGQLINIIMCMGEYRRVWIGNWM